MDIVIGFRIYLLKQKNPPTAITIKNYISDVRKFIAWYEANFRAKFTPIALTNEAIKQYETSLLSGTGNSIAAARSTKRYISSLRKFASFLVDSKAIVENPFVRPGKNEAISDPFYLKEFKNFLFGERASDLTIKNYIADIRQFLLWLGEVTSIDPEADFSNLLGEIDNFALEEYKQRLYTEVQLSPISINRKLSSLRRYIRWLDEKRVLKARFIESPTPKPEIEKKSEIENKPAVDLPLTALQSLEEPAKEESKISDYSSFGPLRFFQKTTKAVSLGTDLLIIDPLATAYEFVAYSVWKKGKKQIFAPVSEILDVSTGEPATNVIKTIIPKAASILPPRSANLASIITKITQTSTTESNGPVKNFTKALYAPLRISTKHFSWQKRLLHKLRYYRPVWYQSYHRFPFVTYFHFSILILAMVIAGNALYQTWNEPLSKSPAVLAEQALAPPRTLAFQGRLLDKTNTPITAETHLRFALYNSPTATGAAKLWQEFQDITPDHNGYFSTILGKISRMDQSIFTDNSSLYLGITIGDNTELLPRQEIPTTNYSANSRSVEGLKPISDAPDLDKNVLLALDSSGNLTIGGNKNHTFQTTGGQFTLSGQALLLTTSPASNGNVVLNPDGSGIIDVEKPLQNVSKSISPGGILGAVEVDDILSVLATTSTQSALVINQNGSGDIVSARKNGIDKFRLDAKGNTFIGGNLILDGDTIDTNSTSFDIGGATTKSLTIGSNADSISIGKPSTSSGVTTIEDSLSVHGSSIFSGPVTANGGITIPSGQKLTLANFTSGAIPFIDSNSDFVQEAASFSWNEAKKSLNVSGSICAYTNTACDSSHTAKGTIYMNSAQTWSGDMAEDYVSSQQLEPGDVVVLDDSNSNAIIRASKPYQPELLGIVSTEPGITLNTQAATDQTHPYLYPLALTGRVPVKVSTINGPIQPGDDLTSSTIPGVAMKAIGPGQIIGKALEAYANTDTSATGKIMAFVNLSYHITPAALANDGNLSIEAETTSTQNAPTTTSPDAGLLAQLNDTANAVALNVVHAENIVTKSLEVTSEDITINGAPLKDYITGVVEQLGTLTKDAEASTTNSSPSANNTVFADSSLQTDQTASSALSSPTSSSSGFLQFQASEIASDSSPIYNSIASNSAAASPSATPTPANGEPGASDSGSQNPFGQGSSLLNGVNTNSPFLNLASSSGKLTYVPNFQSDFATFTQGLIALGPTSVTDIAVNDILMVNNNLKITQNSLDTLGSDLNIQPLRQGAVNFMGGLVAIDTQGNLSVKGDADFASNVTVHGQFSTGLIAPIPNQNLMIDLADGKTKNGASLLIGGASGSAAMEINEAGDLLSSGEAKFTTIASNGFSIIRGVQADTSETQTVAQGSAGKGTIQANQTERTIITPYVTDHSLIYITATSNTGSLTPYLARQTVENPRNGSKGSFTVAIPVRTSKNITFNWWIVN